VGQGAHGASGTVSLVAGVHTGSAGSRWSRWTSTDRSDLEDRPCSGRALDLAARPSDDAAPANAGRRGRYQNGVSDLSTQLRKALDSSAASADPIRLGAFFIFSTYC